MTRRLTGGCLCGTVRYAIAVEAGDVVDYCHCRQCRRASGAPVVAWVQVPPARFEITAGQAKGFAASARATRWFCPHCGSPLYMTDPQQRSVGVTLGTLDEPEALTPTVHGWTSARLAWFDTDDDLPRYDRDPPYDL
jgi:hypothetical protein